MNQIAGNMTAAGKRYGVSRWTVQAFIRMGCPFVPRGRKAKLIIFSEMDNWLKSRQVTAKGVRA